MAAGAASPLPVSIEDFAFQSPRLSSPHSTPKDVRSSPAAPPLMHPQPALSLTHDYNLSSTVYSETSAPPTDHEDVYATTDEETARLSTGGETTSSRSSISSLPASVMVAPPDKPATPPRGMSGFGHMRSGSGLRSPDRRKGLIQDSDRDMTPFRKPSSVRAMQMRDEFGDDNNLTPHHRRHGSHMSAGRLSTFSARSSNSTSTTTSPTKRGGGNRSSHSSPQKSSSKSRKEFPLVLLHCSLLSPTLGLHLKMPESWWLREVLPEEYWKRWKTLEEKVLGNGEVRTRGVLIPHPKAEYELLEERLLESLELERPRVRSGHFLGARQEEVDGAEEESETESTQSSQCPDCGRKVATGVEMERKWEIKVYAANGLMRAGAWSAAWEEMEKVDVEVGVWMPADVRREVEARLHDMGYTDVDEDVTVHGDIEESEEERRRREIYGSPAPNPQEKMDQLFEEYPRGQPNSGDQRTHAATTQHSPAADLYPLALSYLRALVHDRRNVVIAVLSIIVLLYAMTSTGSKAPSSVSPSPSLRLAVVTSTVTTTALSTTMSDCAPPMSNSLLESISALSSTSATETASTQDNSTNRSTATPTPAAAATHPPEESESEIQQTAAVFEADEIPAAVAK